MNNDRDLFHDAYLKIFGQLQKDFSFQFDDVDEILKEYEIIPITIKSPNVKNNQNNKNNQNKQNTNLTKSITTSTIKQDETERELFNLNLIDESQIGKSRTKLDSDVKINSTTKMVIFNLDKYLMSIIKSFKFDKELILHQFQLDFDRSSLYINNTKYSNYEKSIGFFNKYKDNEIKIMDHVLSLKDLLLMLCSQGAFAYLFMLMSDVYNDTENGIYVTSDDIIYRISNRDQLNIILEAVFNLKNIFLNKNLGKINITANIDIIEKDDKYDFCKYGIINWDTK